MAPRRNRWQQQKPADPEYQARYGSRRCPGLTSAGCYYQEWAPADGYCERCSNSAPCRGYHWTGNAQVCYYGNWVELTRGNYCKQCKQDNYFDKSG